ncbi:TIGR02710: CRISPR-associated protein, TIGR02710 family (plasmid) [Rubrobacter radiotolerans]|uniref:TIGR02710 family CRISPR-associated CARF protein n=1 Tax=Rubrobacter radiotolerans TaxID=42256 RepID=A0A023X6L6_RUBRA|nr:TIGR02710 family CRISPR-associated CARF protein [Rubrobacter radiotolerans]AHY48067.1 TIGR02710: CRISPR-associated protein, TIGR02710 family [Rubrobacter radiotolerans]MDX5895342.1 TIGR02710 family CRISPR-associated CARF protein [Rubrobacter radiotolerans]SMC01669.1 CRISPR-associated protein, TIGR02710 family [Rubrobacter radiotolerans DSM 5868]
MPDRAKALILLASRPESVEIAVERLQPEALAVVVSQEVLEAVVLKGAESKDRARLLYRMVDDPMEISDAFSKFGRALADLEALGYAREEVLLDATGGTTPMRLGAALAAMTRGIPMVHQRVPQRYVDGRWERDESKEVEVWPMDNPLEATGLLREGQAVELFNRRDYGAAALVFEDIVSKVSGVGRAHYYRGLLLLSEGYAAWDVADYGVALSKLAAAKGELEVDFSEAQISERAADLVAGIPANLRFLGKVRGRLSVENVVDMLENARRRIVDQGRYDDGVARLYRVVEMHHQQRLAQRSVAASEVDWEKVDEKSRRRFLKASGLEELPPVLDLSRARALDRILSGGVPEEDDTVLKDLLQKRNRSILAHGIEPIGEKAAKRFLELVDGMVGGEEARSGARHLRLRGL